jgi:YesN/AraC family two-component response regulator
MAKILIIDDEQLVASTMEIVLLKAGHVVALASNGNLGVEKFKADPADLVITDIIMPEKEGIEVIRELRVIAPKVPIIAISGGGRTRNYDFLRMAHKLGANEVLRKPFANEELVSLVKRCLAAANESPSATDRPTA